MTELCPHCGGTGWIIQDRDGREYAARCACKSLDRLITVEQKLNIPARFQATDLRGFQDNGRNPRLGQVISQVRNFIDSFPGVEKGILFQGNVGVGKTKMLCAIAGELLIRNPKLNLYYIDWNDLVREMRSGEDHASRDFYTIHELIQRMAHVDLLLFDELGASKVSPWVQDNIYYVINQRYNARKFTCCASNFYDESVDGSETLEQRLGRRIRSRLFEMTHTVILPGRDYRHEFG